MTAEPTKVLIVREPLLQSLLADAFTLAVLGGLPWFNYRFCGGSGWINFAVAAAWLMTIFGRASKMGNRMRPAAAIDWIIATFPNEIKDNPHSRQAK